MLKTTCRKSLHLAGTPQHEGGGKCPNCTRQTSPPCSGSREISSIVTSRRASEGVQRQTSSTPARSEMQCFPQGLLFCRSSDIPGCAMSNPSHLRPDRDGAGRDQPAWSKSAVPSETLECRRKVELRDEPMAIQKKRNLPPSSQNTTLASVR